MAACSATTLATTLTVIATHYDVLGVDPEAPPEQIRAAYRERARRHHPDRTLATEADAMSTINEAYRVLSDPARRLIYDRSIGRRGAHPAGRATPSIADLDDGDDGDDATPTTVPPSRLIPAGPARVPWKMMVVAAIIGSAAILITSTFNDPPASEVPDGILRIGSCVAIEANGSAREVACTGDDDTVVEYLIPTDATCPGSLGAFRDRLGLGTVCIDMS